MPRMRNGRIQFKKQMITKYKKIKIYQCEDCKREIQLGHELICSECKKKCCLHCSDWSPYIIKKEIKCFYCANKV